jgi:hypothetical protein
MSLSGPASFRANDPENADPSYGIAAVEGMIGRREASSYFFQGGLLSVRLRSGVHLE